MNYLTIQEVKEIELKILLSIRDFCDSHNIRYYLAGGTLLGAIRHKGFIPWDDDIDIIMPREDYKKFTSLFPVEGINGYLLYSPYTEHDSCIVFSKVYDQETLKTDREFTQKYWKCGVDIDIFPTDGVPNDSYKCKKYFRRQHFDYKILHALVSEFKPGGSWLKDILRFIFAMLVKCVGKLHIIHTHDICIRINQRAEQNLIDNSEKIAVSIFPHYGTKEIVSKENFLKQIEVSFEGELFTAPSGYDEYLHSLYGDYMKLPPIEKQVTHHLSEFYRK